MNIAVIGCGWMGWDDIQDLSSSPHVSGVVGYEPDPERRRMTQDRFGITVFDRLEPIWDDPAIRLVYITSPNAFHADQAMAAMRHGKSVMLEKPMGISSAEVDAIMSVQRETGAFLQVGLECRYSALYARVKEIVDAGEIGSIQHVNYNYHMSPFEPDEQGHRNWKFLKDRSGGMFQEKLCHYIDLVRWWVGAPVSRFMCVTAPNTIPYYEIPDNMQVTYQFHNGVVSHLSFMMQVAEAGQTTAAGRPVDLRDQAETGHKMNYVIAGTEGAIETSIFHRELRVFHHQGKPGYGTSEHMVRVERWEKKDDHRYYHDTTTQNEDIVRRVAQGLPPAIAPEDAAETMRLCFEMEDAALKGEWRVVERG